MDLQTGINIETDLRFSMNLKSLPLLTILVVLIAFAIPAVADIVDENGKQVGMVVKDEYLGDSWFDIDPEEIKLSKFDLKNIGHIASNGMKRTDFQQ